MGKVPCILLHPLETPLGSAQNQPWPPFHLVTQVFRRLQDFPLNQTAFQSHTAEPVSPPFYVMLLVWQLPTALWMPVLLEETQPAFCIPSLSVDLSTQGHPEKSG